MFDIGWSEFLVIAVVALIAIGPKELPGVLRMVGQWMGKARKMAAEFQGQFQEAMREAEMSDLKKSFDEVKEAATGFTSGNLMTSLERDVSKALDIEGIDKPAVAATDTPTIEPPVAPTTPAISATETPAISKTETPEVRIPETFTEADAQALAAQPLAIVQDVQARAAPQETAPATPDHLKDAKAS
jgi:sec-independent protein translocase protein TatB